MYLVTTPSLKYLAERSQPTVTVCRVAEDRLSLVIQGIAGGFARELRVEDKANDSLESCSNESDE